MPPPPARARNRGDCGRERRLAPRRDGVRSRRAGLRLQQGPLPRGLEDAAIVAKRKSRGARRRRRRRRPHLRRRCASGSRARARAAPAPPRGRGRGALRVLARTTTSRSDERRPDARCRRGTRCSSSPARTRLSSSPASAAACSARAPRRADIRTRCAGSLPLAALGRLRPARRGEGGRAAVGPSEPPERRTLYEPPALEMGFFDIGVDVKQPSREIGARSPKDTRRHRRQRPACVVQYLRVLPLPRAREARARGSGRVIVFASSTMAHDVGDAPRERAEHLALPG